MRIQDKAFKFILITFSLIPLITIITIFLFIFKESIPFLKEYGLFNMLTGSNWNPTARFPSYGILPILLGTIYISIMALIIATPLSVFCAIFLAFYCPKKYKHLLNSLISILAGIPSVVYGFIGLIILVKSVENILNLESGECILTGSILLTLMLLPFLIVSIEETFSKIYDTYNTSSLSVGIPKFHFIIHLVIPTSIKNICCIIILALGRAMGETMAVMMVIGNAPIFPKLLNKSETISSLLALELGSSEVYSFHYSALYTAGLILLIVLFMLNLIFYKIKRKIVKG